MRTCFGRKGVSVVAALFAGATCALGAVHESSLAGGVSPDERLEVVARLMEAANSAAPRMSYVIRATGSHEFLCTIQSSYQSDWNLAKSADVYWNQETSIVAIDEYPWHGDGRIFLIAVHNSKARELSIPIETIAERTGERWDGVRLRINENQGWVGPRTLAINLAGCSLPTDPHPRKLGDPDYDVVIAITPRFRVTIVSVEQQRRH